VDRSNPTRVEILWDQIPSLQDRVQLRTAARLEAAQQAIAKSQQDRIRGE
jgi:hypothetical protein